MSKFEEVTEKYGDLRYMDEKRASLMREIIVENDAKSLLEIGFFKGKSSAYFAAILEDRGGGHLTTVDLQSARRNTPNIHTVLENLDLGHRVTPIYSHRSHTWELTKLIRQEPQPKFDFCYFDGGHTWDVTGFGVLLVDMLLKPGAILVLDDINWTINSTIKRNPRFATRFEEYSADEKSAQSVRMVWDLVLPRLGYEQRTERAELGWGIARKATNSTALNWVRRIKAKLQNTS